MKNGFTAEFVYVDVEGNSSKAGLADRCFDTTRYVLFERLEKPTKQDLEFGFEAPYVEIDDQGHSAYGAVEKVLLEGDCLKITFSEEGSRKMGFDVNTFDVQISKECRDSIEEFSNVMGAIFGSRFNAFS